MTCGRYCYGTALRILSDVENKTIQIHLGLFISCLNDIQGHLLFAVHIMYRYLPKQNYNNTYLDTTSVLLVDFLNKNYFNNCDVLITQYLVTQNGSHSNRRRRTVK